MQSNTTIDIQNLFVPYELSLKLKNVGMNEIAFANYTAFGREHEVEFILSMTKDTNARYLHAKAERLCVAPLFQQAFAFLEYEFGIFCTVTKEFNHYTIGDAEEGYDEETVMEFGFEILCPTKRRIIKSSIGSFDCEYDAQVAMLKTILLNPETKLINV